jgi:alkylhydroperoxidase family enzyme
MSSPRVAPISTADAPLDVTEELARWMPPQSDMEPLALFRTLVRHLPLAQAMRPLGSFLLGRERTLGKREREIVIDRVCARCGCEYEWGVHATVFGAAAGLDDVQLRATARGPATDPAWTPADALLVQLVDELHDTARVSDTLWTALASRWSQPQLLELLTLAGWYHVIAYVANGARVPLESWAARFPAD